MNLFYICPSGHLHPIERIEPRLPANNESQKELAAIEAKIKADGTDDVETCFDLKARLSNLQVRVLAQLNLAKQMAAGAPAPFKMSFLVGAIAYSSLHQRVTALYDQMSALVRNMAAPAA